MPERSDALGFNELVGKMEAACQKLWAEDRVSAIPLQAVANELKIALQQAERLIASLHSQIQATRQECTLQYETKLGGLEKQLTLSKVNEATLQERVNKAEAHIQVLFGQVEAKEEENVQFREKYLKMETEKDSTRAQKMEELILEIEGKDRERESHWAQRQAALDHDFRQRHDQLEAKHKALLEEMKQQADEMQKLCLQKEARLNETQKHLQTEYQAQEARLGDEYSKLAKQSESLSARTRELDAEHEKRRTEIEALKNGLKVEIENLIRQYKPNMAAPTQGAEESKSRHEL